MADRGALEAPEVILASGSPRRAAILRTLGVEPTILATDVDESSNEGEPADHLVTRLARAKLAAAVEQLASVSRPALVIAADTVVTIGSSIMGKPEGKADAERMLTTLSDRTHQVITGMAVGLVAPDTEGEPDVLTGQDVTTVSFRSLPPDLIDWYVGTGEAFDKAGAYGIQGRGGLLVAGIDGSFFNVVGLPIVALDVLCERLGWPLHHLVTASDPSPLDGVESVVSRS